MANPIHRADLAFAVFVVALFVIGAAAVPSAPAARQAAQAGAGSATVQADLVHGDALGVGMPAKR